MAVDSARSRTQKRKTVAPQPCLVLPTSQLQPLAQGVLRKAAWLVLYKMLSTSGSRESVEVVCVFQLPFFFNCRQVVLTVLIDDEKDNDDDW